jgi:Transposase DDE domain group 1
MFRSQKVPALTKTECTQSSFEFAPHFAQRVVADFGGGTLTSDGGALLLRQTDQRMGLLERFAACFTDHRRPDRIEHSVETMLAQRVYGLSLGYEDLTDHDQLRSDPLLAVLAGRRDSTGQQRRRTRDQGKALAGKSTLNRLEHTGKRGAAQDRYKKISYSFTAIEELLVTLFLEAHQRAPRKITLDLDATDSPLYGRQENRFFHGYYHHYCYLPLYIFSGEHLLCARLRPSNIDAAAGSVEEINRIVKQIRERWPKIKIILRADSGFCRDDLMSWCENNQVDYAFGLARNEKLQTIIEPQMEKASTTHARTAKPARVFAEFRYRTRESWSAERRVVAKAEQLEGKKNPRFVVTSLPAKQWPARRLYERFYCARGDMENRIKEQMSLFSDRLSTSKMRANQLRLYLSSMAYVLMQALRRVGLRGTEMAKAQVNTIRLRLLKIGAQVRISVRRVWISMSSGYPQQELFSAVWQNLRC